MTTDDKGEGGSWPWWRHQKEFWKLNRQYTRVTPKPRILHYHQSCCSVIILICIYYCIIHGLFQFHAFCRQTFIDLSDWYIWFYKSSRRFAKSRNWNWHIYWWCNIRGELDDVWWRGGGGWKWSENWWRNIWMTPMNSYLFSYLYSFLEIIYII